MHHHHHTSIKPFIFGILLILTFSFIEAFSGWMSGSLTLLSDSGHMFADAFVLTITAITTKLSHRPPSIRHSYGLGRIEVITALASSLLVALIAFFIIIEAIHRFRHPQLISGGFVALVGLLGLGVNFGVLYLLHRTEKTLNTRAAILHVISDLLGSVVAVGSGLIIYFTNWTPIDPILSLFICILIIGSAFQLSREAFLVLMEGVPKRLDLDELKATLLSIENIEEIHDLHAWTLFSGKELLTAHVEIKSMSDWPKILEIATEQLQKIYHIKHFTLQPECRENTTGKCDIACN